MELMRIICGACDEVLGTDEPANAGQYALDHYPFCKASREQYEAAIYDMKFRQLIKGLGL